MSIKYLIFDFDGTLADSSQGVIASIIYALESYGYEIPDDNVLKKFFGPPLVDSFMEYIGVDEKTGEALTSKYRELYSDNAMYLVELYEGMRELLNKLKDDGIKIAIASSKPRKFFDKLLKKLELTDMFDAVSGAAMDEKGTEKKDIILKACENLGVCDKSEAIMVGDRKFDILGAHAAGIKCIAVTYGFGDVREFENAGADHIVDSPMEIYDLIK